MTNNIKPKIIIVTVYNSENCGSYLQAFSLKCVLEEMGYEAAFYKRRAGGTSHDFSRHLNYFFRDLLKLRIRAAFWDIKKWFTFEKCIKNFAVCDENDDFFEHAECIILGSDTIWNFNSNYFATQASLFLGSQFREKKVISFAASAANTPLEKFKSVVTANGSLSNLSAIMVRDPHTQGLVQGVTDRAVDIVCDPTLLVTTGILNSLYQKIKFGKNFLLLYYFGEIPKPLKNEIIKYSKEHGMDIYSLLTIRDWCDRSIPTSPSLMVSYFVHASAVITNTFHGCALSILYQKAFAVHQEGKKKVENLLNMYRVEDHFFTDNNIDLQTCMEKAPATKDLIEYNRNKSLKLLNNHIKI